MTTSQPMPTNQNCPACSALVFYEGHSELPTALTPHRFHCHRCGKLYIVRSTSHKPPRFRLTPRHEVLEPELMAGGEHLESGIGEGMESEHDSAPVAETSGPDDKTDHSLDEQAD